ncbi:MAG: hypothetical protein GY780_17045 [bacterium]|nr:hypothetical protein [bacterium]
MKKFAILSATLLFVLINIMPAVAQTQNKKTMQMYHVAVVKKMPQVEIAE